jgi:hypothetical protein
MRNIAFPSFSSHPAELNSPPLLQPHGNRLVIVNPLALALNSEKADTSTGCPLDFPTILFSLPPDCTKASSSRTLIP